MTTFWCQCDDCETPLTSPPPRCEFMYNYETTWPTSLRDASSAKQDAGEDTAAARRPRSFNFACAQACLFLHTFMSLLMSCCFEFFFLLSFLCGSGRCCRQGPLEGESLCCEQQKHRHRGKWHLNSNSLVAPLPACPLKVAQGWIDIV